MAFIRLLPKIEVVPVKKRLYSNKRKKTVQKTPSLFETIPFKVLCKIGFNYISEDLIFPKTKNLLNWKQHFTVDLMLNLRQDDSTKRRKMSGTSPWLAKSSWLYWSWNVRLDDGKVRRYSEINLREFSLRKKTTYPRTQNNLRCLSSQTTKALLLWTEQPKTEKINQWKLKTGNKTGGYHGKRFCPQIMKMMVFRKKKRFLDKK